MVPDIAVSILIFMLRPLRKMFGYWVVVHRHRIKDTVTVTNMAGLSGNSATDETLNGTSLIDQNTVSAEAHTERAHRVVERKVV